MKKILFGLVSVLLFVVSCSSSEDSLPCTTVVDCPDSSFICLDGECVLDTAETNDADKKEDENGNGDKDNSGSSDGGNTDSDGSGSEDKNDSDNGSGLPDPVTVDDETQSDSDNSEENDGEGGDDSDNTDTADTADTSDTTDTTDTADTADTSDTTDTTDTADTADTSDTTDTTDTGDSGNVEDPVDPAACAAAIVQLPHGGKYDWEDGTTQGFSDYATYANPYWNVVPATSLPDEVEPVLTHGGNYSFGNYSTYKPSTNHYSVLPATDLSQCSHCKVKAKFYVRGANWITSCDNNNYDYLESTCWDGVKNSWVDPKFDDGYTFLSKRCTYSKQKWTELEWTIPESCKTETFLFALRFKSDSSVEGPGLFVDNLTIYATTSNEPKGEFESAENGTITGWACDPDAYSEKVPVIVRYHKNKNESVVSAERKVYAEIEKTGLTQCGGTNNHGFEIPFDTELATALGLGTHSATVFIGDLPTDCAGTYKKIGTKEFEITSLDPKSF